MSRGLEVLALKESDVTKMLAASTHIGLQNVNFQMKQYVYKRNPDGINIIDLGKTYEKLILAARAIAAIENPADVFAISSRPHGQRAVLKFARFTGATPIAGRFTPGCFTNHSQATFREPRLLVVMDPKADAQPISESSYVNVPVIAFTNTDAPLRYVDIAIPCNTSGPQSIGLMWWMLARKVLELRGTIPRSSEWSVMPDLFFYRDTEEVEREEQAKRDQASNEAAEAAAQAAAAAAQASAGGIDEFGMGGGGTTNGTGGAATEDWTKEWSGGGADEEWSAAANSASWT